MAPRSMEVGVALSELRRRPDGRDVPVAQPEPDDFLTSRSTTTSLTACSASSGTTSSGRT